MPKKYSPLLLLIAALGANASEAPTTTATAITNEVLNQPLQDALKAFSESTQALNVESFERSKLYREWATSLGEQAVEQIKPKNPEADASGVMVFASLGMPETALKQLMKQAADFNVPVVIRGLWQNDFAATVSKVQSLILTESGDTILGGVEINPVWFKQFNIQQVPAFVAIKKGECIDEAPCNPKNYDIVYGNVSLYNALETLANKGAYPEIAQRILSSR